MSLKRFDIKNGAELLANFKVVKIALNSKHGLSKEIAEPSFVEVQNPVTSQNTFSQVETFGVPENNSITNVSAPEPVMPNISATAHSAEHVENVAPDNIMQSIQDRPEFNVANFMPNLEEASMLAPEPTNVVPEVTMSEKLDDSGNPLSIPGDAEKTPININKYEKEITIDEMLKEMVKAIVADELKKHEKINEAKIQELSAKIDALQSQDLGKINRAVETGLTGVIDATARFAQEPQRQAVNPATVNTASEPYNPFQRVA